MQQTQETAAETEAQCLGNFRLEFQRSIVKLQFFQSVAQSFVVVAFHGVKTREYLALYFLEAGQRLRSGVGNQSNRVADFCLSQFFHAGNQKAHFAGFEFLFLNRFRCEYAQLLDLRFRLGAHKAHFVFQLDGAVFHTNQHDHADVVIKPRIDNNRLQRRVFVAGRRGDFGNDFFQNIFHADAAFGGTLHRADGINADNVFDFLFHAFGVGGGQVDFVQNRHDFHA